ncbi:hypothetical protein pipiens_013738 [Culex pipiens pipiens]|uniref:Uncharacterized protein n=1 Tax=Culex pipiens pipiens TaxID=38569 RepID=A0ABD1CXS3_CULPP
MILETGVLTVNIRKASPENDAFRKTGKPEPLTKFYIVVDDAETICGHWPGFSVSIRISSSLKCSQTTNFEGNKTKWLIITVINYDQASTNNNVAPHTTNAQTADNTNALADIPSIDYNNYAPALPFNNNMAPAYQYPCINPNINAPAPPSNQNTNAQEEQPADNNYAPAQPF